MKPCDVCGKPFVPKKRTQQTCGPTCSKVRQARRYHQESGTKKCRTCGEWLPYDRFNEVFDRSCGDCLRLKDEGRKRCQACKEIKSRGDFHRRTSKDGRESICKACSAERSRTLNAHPEAKHKSRNAKYKARYGITVDEYDEMFKQQDGKCAICGDEPPPPLCVDHDHETGSVRELLCLSCNSLLGQAQDDLEILKKSIAYLERHSR